MLKDQLMNDLKEAMAQKDVLRKNVVQMVRAGVLQVEKDNKVTLDDQGVIEVIAKEVKKRKDVLPEFEKAERADLVADTNREIEILLTYLPSQLTETELDEIVSSVVKEVGATSMKDMGKVMAALMPKTKGRADGKTVNELVKKYLS